MDHLSAVTEVFQHAVRESTKYILQYQRRTSKHSLALIIHKRMEKSSYTTISRRVVGKNVHATIPKGNMGYGQCTVPDVLSCRTYFCLYPFSARKQTSMASRAILSNFFEEQ